MTALVLNWRQAFEAGVLTCGGKGYHLAKLHRYGFPVPDGGVVRVDLLGLLCDHWDGHGTDSEALTVDGDAALVRRLPCQGISPGCVRVAAALRAWTPSCPFLAHTSTP